MPAGKPGQLHTDSAVVLQASPTQVVLKCTWQVAHESGHAIEVCKFSTPVLSYQCKTKASRGNTASCASPMLVTGSCSQDAYMGGDAGLLRFLCSIRHVPEVSVLQLHGRRPKSR